ncbi:acetyl-CoA acetyltransferase [Candidatus Woesebacteria bacterium RIFCSPHIGHO2_01_FULL_38_9b]|uniref:Acetyl-CoA acetyltransferase n=1 Tax=Candidatus Woesebacteria bacterium RIFCSPHIGHO2_01_FULL_38_9b TaxID=1802493 RepID=A0A1F7Y1W9_9BACT|nr:MAG: acetyl-CoA acetyltransferase [Candidatus Woesebacteria bacterium RIFCSPHIGHO2_01_FULL_38_9b]
MKKVVVLGTGLTPFGELWDLSLRDLARDVSLAAIADSNLEIKDIDAVFVANMLGSKTAGQSHLGSLVCSELGLDADSTRIEAACASGGLAVLRARESIQSGRFKKVLVVGVEKMSDLSGSEISSALMEAADEEWEVPYGATFAGLYALIARCYMEKYNIEEKHLALVSVKNHYHASLNSSAHFQQEISVEDVLKSAPVASPLKLLDCSPISDGAAAVVLAKDSSYKSKEDAVYILGSGASSDTLALSERNSFTSLPAVQKAALKAYKEAGLSPKDINLAEVHDCFSIAEVLAMEDLGFYEKGKAHLALEEKETYLDGKLPINTSGGLKGCGHPVGATGVKQIVEIVTQLRGLADKRQVKKADIGLTHNVGGTGATSVIHILGRK